MKEPRYLKSLANSRGFPSSLIGVLKPMFSVKTLVFEPLMLRLTNTICDLLVLCVLLYTTKSRDLLYPHEKCLCVPTTNLPLLLKFAFSLKTSDRGCNLCGPLGKQTSGN